MSNIHALRQKKVTLARNLTAIVDKAKAQSRELSDQEKKQYEAGMLELKANNEELDAVLVELEEERNGDAVLVHDGAIAELPGGAPQQIRRPIPTLSTSGKRPGSYAALFGAKSLNNRGFASLDDFLSSVHFGDSTGRLRALASGAGENIPSDGGFLVPESYAAQMLDASLEDEIVRPLANVFPMDTPTKNIAGYDNSDLSGGAPFGGFSIQWLDEGQAATNKKGKTRLIKLQAWKAGLYTIASNELIADGMSFEDMLGTALIQSIGYGLDTAFLQGTGTGQPLGVLNADALITVAKESSQPAATIVYENCANMLGRLHRNCWKNAVWVVNNTALPQLLRMTLNVKNVAGTENVGGSAVPVFAQTPRGYTMFGMPVILTEKLPVVGTVGDILLADFTQYAIGIRKQLSVERSTAIGWQTDESGYRAIVRVDGQPKWNKAYTPRNGSTLSCFVTLATRS